MSLVRFACANLYNIDTVHAQCHIKFNTGISMLIDFALNTHRNLLLVLS